ncbi:hypothetical protein CM240_0129 [Clostridium bornimense]|uniref:Uncharacterized protein n=1 Tax=Clostridium bornimense TaxID=1216932 RepID=W6RST8_9CLOT|nr:hypothetical protein [Clostridium bornimense]CDM67308.1 hypothetical protein CM240_0129 [Clostridium bornimense]
MSKKVPGIIKILLIMLVIVVNPTIVRAENTNIYSTEEDGVWRPTDKITKNFVIKNVWKEKCFLEGISFNRTIIKDIDTGRGYSVEEATKEGILDDEYNVTINMGEEILYSGTIKELVKKTVMLDKPIFMDLDSTVKFSIAIDFNSMAGNELQNKRYEYILYPSAFKVEEDTNIDMPTFITQTGSILSISNLFIGSLTMVIFGILLMMSKRYRRGDDV